MQMQLRAIPTPLANQPASVVIYSANITGGLVQKKNKPNTTKARIHQSKETYYNTK